MKAQPVDSARAWTISKSAFTMFSLPLLCRYADWQATICALPTGTRTASPSKANSAGRKYTSATTRSEAEAAVARRMSTYDPLSLLVACPSTGEVSTQTAQLVLESLQGL